MSLANSSGNCQALSEYLALEACTEVATPRWSGALAYQFIPDFVNLDQGTIARVLYLQDVQDGKQYLLALLPGKNETALIDISEEDFQLTVERITSQTQYAEGFTRDLRLWEGSVSSLLR